jgi:site-specific DNA-methyltransferase (adenine-specific)
MEPTYTAPGVQLYHADCRDLLASLPRIDAVIADPPYGIAHETDYGRFTGGKKPSRDFKPIAGDDEPFDPSPWLTFPNVILFGANCYSDRLPLGSWLVWLKRRDNQLGTFMSDAEVAYMKGGHGVYVFRHVWNGFDRESEARQKTLHPTQKPVALMRWVIERLKLKPGSTILDPYMGSAPVGIAARDAGHNYIGIERDAEHFETAVRRMQERATPLFDSTSRADESAAALAL